MYREWKDVKGFSGRYSVSDDGYVWSNISNKYRKQVLNTKGYCFVRLTRPALGGRFGKNCPVHRLVAQAFIPNPENKPQVNHIDGCKGNNTRGNLEWCTNDENIAHAIKHRLMHPPLGVNHWKCKISEEVAKEIKDSDLSTKELMEKFSLTYSIVYGIKSRKRWKHI